MKVQDVVIQHLIAARFIRRVCETAKASIEDRVVYSNAVPTTLDLDKECDPERLLLRRDFKPEDSRLAIDLFRNKSLGLLKEAR